ncbi:peptidoglycan-binding protein [Streptomyces thermodiastaticus]|uniref:peptidoglycan-binding protein n=1 Tax=Streptomyces thermodiastaticus TaxID=44061 RepID=UPI001671F41F|nr:peptidoglycan-binding protein [Streptomyces thermodiastaticus]MCE7552527.1 peptidoglycan-binding protein [Streptomyces thermodiastaticus]
MSRWRELPADLHPRVRQLVVALRRLKDHSGLSLRQLAAKTGYSAKSWERYLGGRSLPPRDAVEALARIGAGDPTRLLALYEVAADAWERARGHAGAPPQAAGGRAAPAGARHERTDGTGNRSTDGTGLPDDVVTGPAWRRPRGRALHIAAVAAVVTLVLAVSSVILVLTRYSGGDGPEAARTAASTPALQAAAPSPSRPTYTCRFQRHDGAWYAGNSRTQDAILDTGLAGPDIAEAQCLLRRAGFDPGEVDGIYGPRTQSAVKRLQHHAGLVVDGIVGPHTWRVLRG